jgi:microcystin-dependent protein
MPEPFIGEIRMFAGNFAPNGWMFCEGQTMPISENDALFTLIGTTYGGDGQETFQLPNLASRVPIHMGTGPDGTTYTLGESAGVETVTLTTQQIPIHSHPFTASTAAASFTSPAGQVLGQSGQRAIYTEDNTTTNLAPTSITPVGGSQPHENCQPFLCINFIISLFGVFPSQT